MMSYKAMLFDLDDTLLDRDKAVDKLFLFVLEKCYEDVSDTVKNNMLQKFKEYDKREYGISDKTIVLESLFNEFAPKYRLPHNYIQDFWNENFPKCFSIDRNIIHFLNHIKRHFKIGIITNGSTHRQKAKIINTNLNNYFDTIIISEEVGLSKPDKRIFELALNKLNVQPENTLFVGDDLEKDIAGCQNANIKGVWFNPQIIKSTAEIQPYAEINTLDSLLSYVKPQYFYNK
ncbi:2-haloalkanoic acid dehalogenase [Bacillus cereus]|nr:2-haloalkanoic acid dehalogenase [Bacillus cereus]PEZ85328.1 2-haloalkanoic acid dehalogenase [Bacillus cereus]PFA35365.1 2-haloalkanoic acid dehalogenase [Bacillus cereus]PFE57537.1 2-haloalkanoic acid dehalogenase [Bacillus cereus]PFI37919.1 2-haloalkanoic acid dehalogenase [Bacillus cereus]